MPNRRGVAISQAINSLETSFFLHRLPFLPLAVYALLFLAATLCSLLLTRFSSNIYSQSGCHNIRTEAERFSFHLVLPSYSATPFVLWATLTSETGLTKEFFIVLLHTFVGVDVHQNYYNSDELLAVDKENS